MTIRLYDSALVRRLRRATKERIRRDGRRSAKGRWWKGGRGGRAAFWWIWLLANAIRVVAQPENAAQLKAYLLSGTSLALAGVALSRARKLAEKLSTDTERIILLFYPISNRDFFSWATVRFVTRTTWILVLAFVVYFLTTDAPGASAWLIRILSPLAEWLVVLCAILALAQYAHKYPKWLPLTFYIAAGILLIAPERVAEPLRPFALALPTGWLHFLLTNARTRQWVAWETSAALPLLVALFAWLWNRLQVVYCAVESPASDPREQIAEMVEPPQEIAPGPPETPEMDQEDELDSPEEAALPIQAAWQKQKLANWGAEAREYVWQRDWLLLWNWAEMPPIERAAAWCLNQREKGEAQFLLGPKPPAWSERWKVSVIATAVAFAVILSGLAQIRFLAVFAAAVAIALGLPILGGNWPATNQGRISGKLSPIFGCYPLSYWRAGWIMFKLNAVRTVAWMPLGLILSVLEARSAQGSLAHGCWIATLAVLLFLMVMPILLAGKFSKVTNDTLNLRLRLLPFVGGLIVVVILVATLGIVAFFAVSGPWALICLAAVGLIAWGTWAAYGLYYDRAQVDLLRDQP